MRDELETKGPAEILPAPPAGGLDAALLAGSATVAEKALVLQVLLETADIASHLVWAPDTRLRHLDYEHPNPMWMKRVLVGARIDGFAEIGQRMGRSAEACRKLLARAMTALSEEILALRRSE